MNSFLKYNLLFFSCICLVACFNPKQKAMLENMSKYSEMSGQLVKKEFTNKLGKGSGVYEYYFRASIQDYFIKFCESTVSKADVEALNLGEFDTFTIIGEVTEGNWDICSDDPEEMQSRIGKYIRINKIINQ